ncbi:MAG TPA: hypothetical protein VKR43_12940, partial [Bryobacteraceae bacterium]|nr:hypothetical protein [Bryobacteraceae bacterium]
MQKSCWYCHRPLSLFKSFKGELFCDSEHEKLYLSEQFKRVQEPFAPKAPQAKAEPEPAPQVQPVVEEVIEPAFEQAAQPVAEPVAEPAAEPFNDPVRIPEPLPQVLAQAPEPEIIETQAAELRPTPVEAPKAPAETEAEPPAAPLFAWPVNAAEGTYRKAIPEEAAELVAQSGLVPQKIIPARARDIEFQTALPMAASIATALGARQQDQKLPAPSDALAALTAPVRPRLGEASRPAIAGEDFPAAASVATPMQFSAGVPLRIVPEEPVALYPDRIDPRAFDASQNHPELSYGSSFRLQLRSRPAAETRAMQEGLPAAFSETTLSKQVPRLLSLGAAPQPEPTPAVSSQLGPVVSSGIEANVPPANALPVQIALRIPQFAALETNLKPDWSTAPGVVSTSETQGTSAGFESSIPSGHALPSQIAVRISPAAPETVSRAHWIEASTASFAGSQIAGLQIDALHIGALHMEC